MGKVVLLFDTKRFHEDLQRAQESLEPLIDMGIIKSDDIEMLINRIGENITKYVTCNTSVV